jgi:hypothetical protein
MPGVDIEAGERAHGFKRWRLPWRYQLRASYRFSHYFFSLPEGEDETGIAGLALPHADKRSHAAPGTAGPRRTAPALLSRARPGRDWTCRTEQRSDPP